MKTIQLALIFFFCWFRTGDFIHDFRAVWLEKCLDHQRCHCRSVGISRFGFGFTGVEKSCRKIRIVYLLVERNFQQAFFVYKGQYILVRLPIPFGKTRRNQYERMKIFFLFCKPSVLC